LPFEDDVKTHPPPVIPAQAGIQASPDTRDDEICLGAPLRRPDGKGNYVASD